MKAIRSGRSNPAGGRARAALWALAALALLLALPAGAESLIRMNLEDLTRQSDAIVIGSVKGKETKFDASRKAIVTKYRIEPGQYLKGGDQLGAQPFELEQLGGAIQEPMPMTQKLGASVSMMQGEKVLLFLDMKNRSEAMDKLRALQAESRKQGLEALRAQSAGAGAQSSQSPASGGTGAAAASYSRSPMIVGAWQGRYTIVKNSEGREVALRPKADANPMPSANDNLRMVKAVSRLESRSASGAAAEGAGPAPAVKSDQDTLLDFMAPPVLRDRALALDDIKGEIRTYVERQKKDGLKKAALGEAQIVRQAAK